MMKQKQKQKKQKTWFRRAMAVGLSFALTLTCTPTSGMQVQAAEKESKVTVDSEQVDASNYELLNNVQGASILHCWNWSYKTIEENMELIAQSGYTAIQTSPAQQPKDYNYQGHVGSEVGYPGVAGKGNWWKLYQPVTFNVCDNGLTWLGTKAELESMCKTAEKYGIKVIVDIVANHMGNIKGWQNSLSDISPQVGEYWNKDMMTDESFWHINDLQIWMSDGREHFTQGTMGMPDLNTANKTVQKYVYEYLDELIDCGVDGFRFDAAKHIETPDDAGFGSDFWPTVLNEARSHYKSVAGGDLFVYGEILNTVGDNFSIDSYTKYMSVTDNSAGHHLLESIRNNQLATPQLHYAANKAVIWAESHDTYMNESSRYASDKSIVRAWAFAANKKDASALFFTRPYYSEDTLIDGRDGAEKGNLVNDLAPAMMGECETYVWASKEVAAINHFSNRMAGSADEMGADGNIGYVKRGNGIILVNMGGAGAVSTGAHGLADGSYTDEVSGGTFTVSGGTVSGTITSEYGIAVLYQNPMSNPSDVRPVKFHSSVADGSNFYLDTLGLTLTAEFADSASYETSAGEKGTIKDGTRVNVGKGVAVGEDLTVTVTGTNDFGTYEKTYTYHKKDLDLDQCIFFKNSKNWTKVNAYIYNEVGKEVTATNTGWSGEPMFEYEEAADGSMIYAVMVEDIDQYNKVNFNNNVAELQASLGTYGQMFDSATGSWTKFMEPGSGKAKVSSTLESATIHGAREVTYTVSNADSAVYSIDGGKETSFTDKVTITVGEDLEEGKSQTVKIVAAKGDKTTEKVYTYTMGENKPEVHISPKDGDTFKDTLEVTVTADNTEEATYQVGEEKAVAFSGTKTITVGKDMKDGDIVKIKVYGKSSNGKEDTATAIFTKEEENQNTGSCIYFKNTKDWSSVNAYAWVDDTTSNGKWPGVAMTLCDKENKIYSVDLGTETEYKKVIFSQNGQSQTDDLTLPGLGQLYDSGTGKWSQYGEQGLKISSSLTSRTIEGETEVTFQAKAAKSATVSVNGADAEKFTDSVKVTVGKNLNPGEEAVVKVTASDGKEEITRTFVYIMKGTAQGEEKQKMTGITVKDSDVLYDGEEHSITVDAPKDTTIRYGTSQGNYTSEKAPAYKEPGNYTIYFKVSKSGYEDYTGKGTVVINGLQVTSGTTSKDFVTFEEAAGFANGLKEKSTITLYTDITLEKNVILNDKITVDNKKGATLTIPSGITLENGTLAGNVKNDGILRNVTISDSAKVSGNGKEEKTDVIATPEVSPTVEPNPTKAPGTSEKPATSQKPGTTIQPDNTSAPTENPGEKDTLTPGATPTAKPEQTETPGSSNVPSGTKTPDTTSNPTSAPTDVPGGNNTPIPSKAPGADMTPAPDQTVKPQETVQPTGQPTSQPFVTATPDSEQEKLKITAFSVNPNLVQVVKKKVKLSVAANGGTGNYSYTVEVYKNGALATTKTFSSTKKNITFSYTPNSVGSFRFKVIVTDEAGKTAAKSKTITIVAKQLKALSLQANRYTAKKGQTIKFTMKASGGKTPYRYRYTVYTASGREKKTTNYITKKTWSWKAEKKGNYKIKVTVKDATGTTVTKTSKLIKIK